MIKNNQISKIKVLSLAGVLLMLAISTTVLAAPPNLEKSGSADSPAL